MLAANCFEGLVEAGCDEAGRGCLAGSVFAAAVILPPDYENGKLNDSKQLTEKKPKARKMLCGGILAAAAILLVWFFPALSGLPVAKGWATSMKWFSSWLLYPI